MAEGPIPSSASKSSGKVAAEFRQSSGRVGGQRPGGATVASRYSVDALPLVSAVHAGGVWASFGAVRKVEPARPVCGLRVATTPHRPASHPVNEAGTRGLTLKRGGRGNCPAHLRVDGKTGRHDRTNSLTRSPSQRTPLDTSFRLRSPARWMGFIPFSSVFIPDRATGRNHRCLYPRARALLIYANRITKSDCAARISDNEQARWFGG